MWLARYLATFAPPADGRQSDKCPGLLALNFSTSEHEKFMAKSIAPGLNMEYKATKNRGVFSLHKGVAPGFGRARGAIRGSLGCRSLTTPPVLAA